MAVHQAGQLPPDRQDGRGHGEAGPRLRSHHQGQRATSSTTSCTAASSFAVIEGCGMISRRSLAVVDPGSAPDPSRGSGTVLGRRVAYRRVLLRRAPGGRVKSRRTGSKAENRKRGPSPRRCSRPARPRPRTSRTSSVSAWSPSTATSTNSSVAGWSGSSTAGSAPNRPGGFRVPDVLPAGLDDRGEGGDRAGSCATCNQGCQSCSTTAPPCSP